MSDNLIFVIAIAIFLVVFGIALMRVLKKAKRIDSIGIETDAVVSRVERSIDTSDSSGSSYYTYVKFTEIVHTRTAHPLRMSCSLLLYVLRGYVFLIFSCHCFLPD